jgi:hypothetical protein
VRDSIRVVLRYLLATFISTVIWALFGWYLIAARQITGPPVVGALTGWVVGPLLFGLIPCGIADFIVTRLRWPRLLLLGVLAGFSLLASLLLTFVKQSGVTGVGGVAYGTGLVWIMFLPFALPLLLFGHLFLRKRNRSNRVADD